ncbi:hypothetical protein ACFVZ3_15485 [Kitasatospora purpeofusca]|uniref:hypothetical protein n=1 Tax=Kitasatospora purpeofusca TaxID=67352 RepID=UPI0036868A93
MSTGSVQVAGTAPPWAASRWLAPAGVAATGAGPIAAGLQGNVTIAVISAAPGLVLVTSLFFGVICPAVWSRRTQRQKAALNVLTALIGRGSTATSTAR